MATGRILIEDLGDLYTLFYTKSRESHFVSSSLLGEIILGKCKRDQHGELILVGDSLLLQILHYSEELSEIILKIVEYFLDQKKFANTKFPSSQVTKNVYSLVMQETKATLENTVTKAKYTFESKFQFQQFIKHLSGILPSSLFDFKIIKHIHNVIHTCLKKTSSIVLKTHIHEIQHTVNNEPFACHAFLSEWTTNLTPKLAYEIKSWICLYPKVFQLLHMVYETTQLLIPLPTSILPLVQEKDQPVQQLQVQPSTVQPSTVVEPVPSTSTSPF